jgi:hypothetical protein
MKIAMRSADAIRRARQLYDGASLPISVLKEGRDALQIDWWISSPRPEQADSERQQAGLRLYLEIGTQSRPELGETAFPAVMDFDDSAMRPDKGIIKALIDNGLICGHLLGAQLVFTVTEKGQGFLAQAMPSPTAGPNRTP